MHKTIINWLAAVTLLVATTAFGQEITGNIVGTVTDQSGAVVAGAAVTVTNLDKNLVVRTVTTEANGNYAAPLLPIGHYSITVDAKGFRRAVQRDIDLNVNERLTINLALTLGDTSEVVEVTANPLQVELQSAAATGLITGTQLRELSLNNRNYAQFLTLMPGVSSTASDQLYVGNFNPLGTNTVNFSINGQRTSANNWTVDGADNVDRGSSLTLLNYPSIDAIAEFKVLRGLYNAEFGRGAGGQVNVITRSGGEKYHGSAYEFFRNDKISANSYINKHFSNPASVIPRPPLRYNNFGWTFGGPVPFLNGKNRESNKTFFFFSQEFRRVITNSTLIGFEPTAAEMAGNFSNPVCVAFTGTTCTATGTQITAINPVAAAYIQDIFSKLPAPNDATDPHRLTSSVRNVFNFRQELIKVDHVFSPKFAISGRFLQDSIPTVEPRGLFPTVPSQLPLVGTTESDSPGRSFVGRATAAFSPTLLLEVGYNYSYGAILSDPVGLISTANSPNIQVALPFTSTLSRAPNLTFNGGSDIASFGPYRDYNRNHQVFGNLAKLTGSHSLKWGGSYYHYNKRENAGRGNEGTFNFQNTGLPAGRSGSIANFEQSFANFLLGNAVSFSQASFDRTPDIMANQVEFYAQDEFRARPNLTISYGLRYSAFRQPTDAAGHLTNFDPTIYDPAHAPCVNTTTGNLDTTCNPNFDPLNGILIADQNSPFDSKVTNENHNLAPRLGIAWDPFGDGKTSVRTGYGMFFDTILVGVIEQNIFTNKPFVQDLTISNTRLDNPGAGTTVVSAAPPAARSFVPRPYFTPYSQNWSLDVQREVARGFLVDVGYYGAKGTHLIGAIDINQPVPGAYAAAGLVPAGTAITSATTPRLNAVRPFVGYPAINALRTIFSSNYNSLQVSGQKRFSGNSQISVAYTWSKSLTDNQTDRSTAAQNTYDIAAEYGLSQQDRPHIFTVNYVYELPFFRNQGGIAGHVLGGWEFSGIVTYQSGSPFTVTGSTSGNSDPAGQGCLSAATLCSVRPDLIGDPNSGAQTVDAWFNTGAFADVPASALRGGTSPRGVIRGPGIERWDISVFKNFKLYESVGLQFRAEAFNAFNHTNPDIAAANVVKSNALFGRATQVRDPRIMQLGLKLNF